MRPFLRTLFALFFVTAGVMHAVRPDAFVAIMPPYLPSPLFLVYVSGAAEFGLGVLLLFRRSRRFAGWGLVALLIAIFPANIHMAMHPDLFPSLSKAMLLIRLPIQFVLIAWAYSYTRSEE